MAVEGESVIVAGFERRVNLGMPIDNVDGSDLVPRKFPYMGTVTSHVII